jgi:oligopeptide/dipeptide ABC transporter ATP-binding protein
VASRSPDIRHHARPITRHMCRYAWSRGSVRVSDTRFVADRLNFPRRLHVITATADVNDREAFTIVEGAVSATSAREGEFVVPMPIIELRDLRISVIDADLAASIAAFDEALTLGWVEVIPGVSLALSEGESLALVGESGSGKSLILMGGFGLLAPGARSIGGETRFRDLAYRPGGPLGDETADDLSSNEWDDGWAHAIGTEVGFLFQDPIGAWMPVEVIGEQSGEAIGYHEDLTQEEIDQRVFDALGDVGLPKSNRMFGAFSSELSRGMAQRAMLAAALTKAPSLLIADEPLNGLDVSVAAAIMDLITDMRRRRGMAMIIVSHDLAAVARVADRIAVVYGGVIIEDAAAADLFHEPKHPYTSGLLGSIPGVSQGRLRSIRGEVPRLVDIDRGSCVFADRCDFVIDRCTTEPPLPRMVGASSVACHRANELDLPGING